MIRWLRLLRLVAADLRLLWFALRHPRLYALDPVNFALPLAGVVDDLVLVPLLVHLVVRLLPTEIKLGFALRSPH
jgi:uncharacterized membrane protein YkvA (DUF1232 family)